MAPPRRPSATGRRAATLAAAVAVAGLARAQVPLAPPTPAAVTAEAGPAQLPPIPDQVPARFAVMAFENRSGVRVLDWNIAGLPLVIGERIERVAGLAPAYDPYVVPPGPAQAATAATVASFARPRAARWVITGWVERPDWQLRAHVVVWRVDGDVAAVAGEREAVGPLATPHEVVGPVVAGALADAGIHLDAGAAAALARPMATDPYALLLLGRGLGRALGSFAPVDRAGSIKDLVHAVLIDPTLVSAQRLLGQVWSTDPDPAVARKAAGKFAYAADLDPGDPAAARAVAERAASIGDWRTAMAQTAALVRARPWDLDARVALGRAAWRAGAVDLAQTELDRVVTRRPDDLDAHRVLAEIAGARGPLTSRVRELETVARLAPTELAVQVELAAAYAEAGQLAQATTLAERVAAARPGDATAQKRVGDLYRRRGQVDDAVRWYAAATRLAPTDPRPVLMAGLTLLDAGRYPEARARLAAAQQFPDYQAGTWTALGAAAYLEGKFDEALGYWRRAGQAQPRSVAIRYDLALAASAAGAFDRALTQLAVVDTLAPADADAAFLRGVIAYRRHDVDAARAGFLEALRREPGHVAARANLTALARGTALVLEGHPRIELPFGDRRTLLAALDRFATAEATMGAMRTQIEAHALALLAALGEGPAKDPAVSRTLRGCPINDVAARWALANDARRQFIAAGVELEEAYAVVATFEKFGEVEGASPSDRRRVAAAGAGYRAAKVDLRELDLALDDQVHRELARRRCTDDLLAAAAADPALYRVPTEAPPAPTIPARTEPEAAPAAFSIDNRECLEAVAVYLDGVWVAAVDAGAQTTVRDVTGRHTLCLLPQPSAAACGDRGTIRELYLHDGWAVRMRCPRTR